MDALALLCHLAADGSSSLTRLRRAGYGSLQDVLLAEDEELGEVLGDVVPDVPALRRQAEALEDRMGHAAEVEEDAPPPALTHPPKARAATRAVAGANLTRPPCRIEDAPVAADDPGTVSAGRYEQRPVDPVDPVHLVAPVKPVEPGASAPAELAHRDPREPLDIDEEEAREERREAERWATLTLPRVATVAPVPSMPDRAPGRAIDAASDPAFGRAFGRPTERGQQRDERRLPPTSSAPAPSEPAPLEPRQGEARSAVEAPRQGGGRFWMPIRRGGQDARSEASQPTTVPQRAAPLGTEGARATQPKTNEEPTKVSERPAEDPGSSGPFA